MALLSHQLRGRFIRSFDWDVWKSFTLSLVSFVLGLFSLIFPKRLRGIMQIGQVLAGPASWSIRAASLPLPPPHDGFAGRFGLDKCSSFAALYS